MTNAPELTPAEVPYQPSGPAARHQAVPQPTVTAGVAPPPLPPAEAASRVVPPRPVINAVRLIYLGGLLAASAAAVTGLDAWSVVRAALQQQGAVDGVTVPAAVIRDLIATGLWLWMARQ